MKLRDVQAQHRGLDALVMAPPEDVQERQALEQRLEDTGLKLAEARTGIATLDDYLNQVCNVCNHPSHFLRVRHNSVTVDRMGIVPDAMSHIQGAEVVSATVSIGANPPVEVVLAAFQRTGMA